MSQLDEKPFRSEKESADEFLYTHITMGDARYSRMGGGLVGNAGDHG